MSSIRLYLDEDILARSLVQALRNAQIDVITTAEANNLGFSDEQQLRWATENNRTIYTYNVGDFCRLHQLYLEREINHNGIIISKQNYSIGQQLKGLLNLIKNQSALPISNELKFLGNYFLN